ncbi:hypothetical protein, variant 6 [Aphanomyces astaci]|uniref:DNA ligase n=1 Tax=Aphanomyces astaci TaxID=112090 RepID=W4G2Y1_APHAT|nr:hypothetical protein, variant 6 [Aphanomyces astaci]ETV73308.1 hypothetical protein, variant 6 [Aphanomyces astaci]|eukprot:XP_009837183.1 hypothetical protein, variant 6 [Aphanomyces astaci]
MSKRQQSIMSFFGAKPAEKTSDAKVVDATEAPPSAWTPAPHGESVAPSSPSDDSPNKSKTPQVAEIVVKKTPATASASKKAKKSSSPPPSPEPKRKRLRRTIVEDDSSDDDDMFTEKKVAVPKKEAAQAKDSGIGGHGLDDIDALPEQPVETAATVPTKEEPHTKPSPSTPHDDDHGLLLLYNPKEKNPMKRGGWTAGDPVPYAALSKVFAVIEDESSRLIIQDTLADFFRSVIELTPSDLVSCIYLCVCTELAPAYDNVQIGIGDAILIKSIGEATGTTPKFVKDLYQKQGDLGKVAQASRSKQSTLMTFQTKPKPLAVAHVYNDMVKIAKMSGNNSQASKCSIIKSLLVRCDKLSDEAKYVIRGLQGKLRIGLAGQSILMSLTQAFMHPKEQGDKALQAEALKHVKRAFSEFPNYEVLASSLLTVFTRENDQKGVFASQFVELAEFCHLTAGTPVSPMLARPTKSYAMVLDRFQAMPFTCEYKYDGERAQIHILPNGDIRIFSRNFENSTERFPDVKLSIANAAAKANVTSCIVDAEVVAVDKTTNQRLPFQVLSTRPRKNVVVSEIKVAVCIYAFDLLFLNGKSFLKEPLQARREALKGMFQVTPGSFEFATSLDVANTKDDDMESTVEIVRNFLEEAVAGNCEGLMVKTLSTEATYEPANRSHKWLKLKKDYLDGIGDSTDLVPVGAFYGRGKRTGVYGAYLLACYDPETEMYQCITKV